VSDIKAIIAKNITALRQNHKMTQIELAEKLNYSDKAVSKWERGESVPDISVLKQIADLFGVTVDYLLQESHEAEAVQQASDVAAPAGQRNQKVITVLSVLLVWLVATMCFIALDIVWPQTAATSLSFLYGVPVSMIVWLVFNSIWFNRRRNYLIISLLMWSTLACIFLTLLAAGHPIWKFFLLGIPGQIAIYVWSRFQLKNK
jgi:transcriptional regulator with XRE-family HTH domain